MVLVRYRRVDNWQDVKGGWRELKLQLVVLRKRKRAVKDTFWIWVWKVGRGLAG